MPLALLSPQCFFFNVPLKGGSGRVGDGFDFEIDFTVKEDLEDAVFEMEYLVDSMLKRHLIPLTKTKPDTYRRGSHNLLLAVSKVDVSGVKPGRSRFMRLRDMIKCAPSCCLLLPAAPPSPRHPAYLRRALLSFFLSFFFSFFSSSSKETSQTQACSWSRCTLLPRRKFAASIVWLVLLKNRANFIEKYTTRWNNPRGAWCLIEYAYAHLFSIKI